MSGVFEYTDLKGLVSGALDIVAYNDNDNLLLVRFNSGGDYVYHDVPFEVFNGFGSNNSEREYWRYNVSNKYDSSNWGQDTDLELVEPVKTQAEVQDVTKAEDVSDTFSGFEDLIRDFAGSSKYSVKYVVHATDSINGSAPMPNGPFEPEYLATDETDALRQFNDAIEQAERLTGWDLSVEVKAVTHHFE